MTTKFLWGAALWNNPPWTSHPEKLNDPHVFPRNRIQHVPDAQQQLQLYNKAGEKPNPSAFRGHDVFRFQDPWKNTFNPHWWW